MRKPGLVVTILVLITAFAREAAAQSPTVTVQQNGQQLRVDWNGIPGATYYEAFVTGSLVGGPIPVPTTFFVVTPPPGTYTLQVRARTGSAVGPLSDPVTVTVSASPSPPGCSAVGAPTISSNVSGQTVTITWGAVAGAAGYILQVGYTPGGTVTQVQLPAGQTSYTANGVPLGIYYVRLLAGNGCGAPASSNEQTVTVGASQPGPAPPAPGPGSELPFPIPAACAASGTDGYPCATAIAALSTEWALCRSGNGVGCQRFTRQVVYALSRSDPNWKMIRAAPGGHACGCASCGPSDGTMFREDTTVYGGNRVFDMIAGAGGPSPGLWWNEVVGPRAGDIPADAPVCR